MHLAQRVLVAGAAVFRGLEFEDEATFILMDADIERGAIRACEKVEQMDGATEFVLEQDLPKARDLTHRDESGQGRAESIGRLAAKQLLRRPRRLSDHQRFGVEHEQSTVRLYVARNMDQFAIACGQVCLAELDVRITHRLLVPA